MIIDQYNFDSITEYGEFVAQARPQKGAELSSQDVHGFEWYGGQSFADSVAMARAGGNWTEGAANMQPISLADMDIELHALPRPALGHDLAGFMPDVPAYLNNDPDCMFTIINEPSDNRLIRIGVQIARASTMKQTSIYNQGTAILSVIDELTTRGYSVELTAFYAMVSGNHQLRVDVQIKRADDRWSPESVAFALCHVGFSRHLGFRVNEQSEKCQSITHDSYGYGKDDRIDVSMFDISFGYLIKNGLYTTQASALKSVIYQVNKQIKGKQS